MMCISARIYFCKNDEDLLFIKINRSFQDSNLIKCTTHGYGMHMISWQNDQNYAVLSKQKYNPCFNLKSLRLNPNISFLDADVTFFRPSLIEWHI